MTMDVAPQLRYSIYGVRTETPKPTFLARLLPRAFYQPSPVKPIELFPKVGHSFFITAKVQSSRTTPSPGLQIQKIPNDLSGKVSATNQHRFSDGK